MRQALHGGPVGKQKGAQREVQQEEYCNPGVISLPPICSQVGRPVLLPCLPLPRPSPSLPFLPSRDSHRPWCTTGCPPTFNSSSDVAFVDDVKQREAWRMTEDEKQHGRGGMIRTSMGELSSNRYLTSIMTIFHECLVSMNGVASAHLLPLLHILPLHDVW